MAPRDRAGPLRPLSVVATLASIFLLHLPAAVSAQDDQIIDCYGFGGVVAHNNTKCPNSNACCGVKATCLSNRLCANPGDGPSLWVRGPCAVNGWDEGCAQICLYDEANGVFPRVTECSDGSICCNNDPQCCQDGKGVFLDASGNVASSRGTAATTSYPPASDGLSRITLTPSTSTTSTSTITTSTSSSTATTSSTSSGSGTSTSASGALATTSSSASSTPVPDSGSDGSIGLKVGLGLGIPLAILITACVAYLFFGRRNRRVDDGMPLTPPQYQSWGAHTPTTIYSGVPKPEAQYGPYPVELGVHQTTELDASPAGQRPRYEIG